MPFTIQPRRLQRAAVLALEGELVMGPALTLFNQEARAMLEAPVPQLLVLDLALVHRVDSAGLGELIMLHSLASSRNVKIAIASPPRRVIDMLTTTRVDGIFPCFPDVQAALDS